MAAGDVNKIILVGRVTRGPIIKPTKAGVPHAVFGLSTTEIWFDKATDSKRERTTQHKIVVYGGPLVTTGMRRAFSHRQGPLAEPDQGSAICKSRGTNPAILARAHRRPAPSVSFPYPIAKEKQPMVASLEPRVADNQNVDDASEALAQLRQIARDRWPNETEAQAFLNVMTTAEYGDLIHRALARPTGSTPPRQS
jgi:hypothetical protein